VRDVQRRIFGATIIIYPILSRIKVNSATGAECLSVLLNKVSVETTLTSLAQGFRPAVKCRVVQGFRPGIPVPHH